MTDDRSTDPLHDLERDLHAGLPQVDHLRASHVAAMLAAWQEPSSDLGTAPPERSRSRRMLTPMYAKVAAGMVAALLGTTGLAMAGTLPEPAQDAVAAAAEKAGFTLPRGHDDAGDGGTEATSTDEASGTEETSTTTDDAEKATHGDAVSAVAHDDALSGREKGQAVAAVARTNGAGRAAEASDGRSAAGQANSQGAREQGGRPEGAGNPHAETTTTDTTTSTTDDASSDAAGAPHGGGKPAGTPGAGKR